MVEIMANIYPTTGLPGADLKQIIIFANLTISTQSIQPYIPFFGLHGLNVFSRIPENANLTIRFYNPFPTFRILINKFYNPFRNYGWSLIILIIHLCKYGKQ
jgi:hypothetical protein